VLAPRQRRRKRRPLGLPDPVGAQELDSRHAGLGVGLAQDVLAARVRPGGERPRQVRARHRDAHAEDAGARAQGAPEAKRRPARQHAGDPGEQPHGRVFGEMEEACRPGPRHRPPRR
jgi:hypothetical protein